MASIQALRLERNAYAKEAANLLDGKGSLNSNEQAEIDAIYAKIDGVDALIARKEKLAELEADKPSAEIARTKIYDNVDKEARAMAEFSGRSVDEEASSIVANRAALTAYIRYGKDGISALSDQSAIDAFKFMTMEGAKAASGQKIRAAGVSPASAGGVLVQTDVYNQITERIRAFGGLRSVAQIWATSQGNPILFPTIDDTSNTGELVAEAVQATTQDVTFGSVTLSAFKFSSKMVPVSIELIQDEQINVLPLLYRLLATRIGRSTNTFFTTGTGTSQPQGVVTAASSGKVGATGQTTSITYDDMVDLEHSIDPGYRKSPSVAYMMHDTALRQIKKLKDTTGRPLWTPGTNITDGGTGLAAGDPATIQGYRYVINQDMPVMAASAKSILFGDFSLFTIRDVMQTQLFRFDDSAWMSKGQVAFMAWMRADSRSTAASGSSWMNFYQNSAT